MVVWWIVIHYCMVALSSSSAHSSSSFCSHKVTGAHWPLGVAFVPKHKGARVADTSTLILQDRMWMGTGPPLTVFWPQTRELIYPATIKLVYFIALLVCTSLFAKHLLHLFAHQRFLEPSNRINAPMIYCVERCHIINAYI